MLEHNGIQMGVIRVGGGSCNSHSTDLTAKIKNNQNMEYGQTKRSIGEATASYTQSLRITILKATLWPFFFYLHNKE